MPSFIDLFAGCGGFSVGMRAAGWTSLAEVEIDAWACDSLRRNFPESHIIEADIRSISDNDILALGPVDLIIGGPPCQGFSVAGSTQFGIDDPRNELFRWFLRWVQLLRPKAALIENVPNILSRQTGGATVISAIQNVLGPLGYTVSAKVLNSADFGVPQARRRAFIVMSRGHHPFEFPLPSHGPGGGQEDLFAPLKPYTTVGQALSDLPAIAAGEGSDEPVPYATAADTEYQVMIRGDQKQVCNHIAMKHTARLIERFKIISPGQSLKDVPQSHGQLANHTGKVVKNPFKYNNYRLDPSKPSLAIPASFQSLFLHPQLDRNLTAREAARLMGFPDAFVFCGKRTTMSWEKNLSQYNQIGNAVCPPVAKAIGEALLHHVEIDNPRWEYLSSSIIPIKENSLKRISTVPTMYNNIPISIIEDLRNEANRLGQSGHMFRFKGHEIPSEALSLALILVEAEDCPVCSPDMSPHAHHNGEMCFLISKEGNDSLIENEQDHGLDFHLRSCLNIDKQVGHFVGERLSELGLVELIAIQNPRTGRNVRGMRLLRRNQINRTVRQRVIAALQECGQPERHLRSAVGR